MFQKKSTVRTAWRSLRGGFAAIAMFSMVLNLLMLAGPLYMLQVYDRVLTSQNLDTLIALSILLGGVFVVTGLLDLIRMRILARLAARFELTIGAPILQSAIRRRVQGKASGDNSAADVAGLRDFIAGPTLTAFFDAPWIPLYLGVLYILHPYLGALGLAGAVFLTLMALINNARSSDVMQEANQARSRSDRLFTASEQNAELVHAMGMTGDLARRWTALQHDTHRLKSRVSDRIASFSVMSKTTRMALQSGMLGLGAALAVTGQATAGVMIAATIVLARALSPIDQLIGQWRTFLAARGSYKSLRALSETFPEQPKRLALPRPQISLNAVISQAGPPLAQNATIGGVDFALSAGDVLAVIGHSGSGKSTLAKMLAGIWVPQRGAIRLDGNPMAKWDPENLGQLVGYLPQDVQLFDGTIRENIARFSTSIDDTKVLAAAQAADVHGLISTLPDGYATEVGNGFHLSGGQRQRIALARALYDDPFVLVLDEPNSDLDTQGEQALRNAIRHASERGAITFVMTHRPSTLEAVNKVLTLSRGTQTGFGDKEDILRPRQQAAVPNGASPKPAAHPIVAQPKTGAAQ
ncbi:Type I secretion system ATP-binding protein PrsD [Falsiruegeria litorea R37]|uniref:Type I secretion system ATP-binding protein PrsD n=1 Tax=Falsiruegeria litorea R37 TaxID=1200284 RepID=A0A1Y5TUR6_9RHOB|nr:type I secretion system permease/ATPase [Falsiruegeria litorea]SLN73463.1 Type I secretion system ATP-binding protein PrsD [Falsiruegeria litorea R37]